MPEFIPSPSVIKAAGNKPKVIEEFIGRVNNRSENISLARMKSPEGWREPGQRPEFDEYTFVLKGTLSVKTKSGIQKIAAGQAVIIYKGEWVCYSTPEPGGAEYISVCIPAFSPDTVHRDDEAPQGK